MNHVYRTLKKKRMNHQLKILKTSKQYQFCLEKEDDCNILIDSLKPQLLLIERLINNGNIVLYPNINIVKVLRNYQDINKYIYYFCVLSYKSAKYEYEIDICLRHLDGLGFYFDYMLWQDSKKISLLELDDTNETVEIIITTILGIEKFFEQLSKNK